MKKYPTTTLYGIAFTFILAVPAYLLGRLFPVIGAPIFGIAMGIGIASFGGNPYSNLSNRLSLDAGIRFTSKKILQYAIILLGFEMNLYRLIEVGLSSLTIILGTISASLLSAYVMAKVLKIDWKIGTLIGVGTSICGGSAIAATAPVIDANEEEVAHSISTIFLFNIVAVFLFPLLGQLLGMSDEGFGYFAGTAINDTSSVVAASTAWSTAAGNNTALLLATVVKLTRTLMIIPITLILSFYRIKKEKDTPNTGVSIRKIFPWFVLYFVIAAILRTFLPIPDSFANACVHLGKFMIVMAMTAIGLNTQLMRLLKNGLKPIGLGLVAWFCVAITSLIIQSIQHII